MQDDPTHAAVVARRPDGGDDLALEGAAGEERAALEDRPVDADDPDARAPPVLAEPGRDSRAKVRRGRDGGRRVRPGGCKPGSYLVVEERGIEQPGGDRFGDAVDPPVDGGRGFGLGQASRDPQGARQRGVHPVEQRTDLLSLGVAHLVARQRLPRALVPSAGEHLRRHTRLVERLPDVDPARSEAEERDRRPGEAIDLVCRRCDEVGLRVGADGEVHDDLPSGPAELEQRIAKRKRGRHPPLERPQRHEQSARPPVVPHLRGERPHVEQGRGRPSSKPREQRPRRRKLRDSPVDLELDPAPGGRRAPSQQREERVEDGAEDREEDADQVSLHQLALGDEDHGALGATEALPLLRR